MLVTIPASADQELLDVYALRAYLTKELQRYFDVVHSIDFNDDDDSIRVVVSFGIDTDTSIVLTHYDGSDDDWFTFVGDSDA